MKLHILPFSPVFYSSLLGHILLFSTLSSNTLRFIT